MEITERFALHARLWDTPRRWGGGGSAGRQNFCSPAQGKGLRAGNKGHETGDEHRQGQRSRAGPVHPSVRPSVPLALPGDVMLERKHTRSLNTSSPLQRSDAGADGCGDRQLCSGSSSLGAVMRPEGCNPPGRGWPGDASSMRASAKHAESRAGKAASLGIRTGAAGRLRAAPSPCQ